MQPIRIALLAVFLVAVSASAETKLKMPTRAAAAPLDPKVIQACLLKDVLDRSKFTDAEYALIKDLQDAKEPAFDHVTAAWLESYLDEYNKSHGSALPPKYAFDVLRRTSAGGPDTPHEFKKYFDGRLQKGLLQKPLAYNEAHPNPLEGLLDGRTQCAGGTVLYSLATRHHWGATVYAGTKPLIIMEYGHVLPGFVMLDDANVPHLVGVETTLAGRAVKEFGPVADLAKNKKAVRVLDARQFALLDIFADKLPAKVLECWEKAAAAHTATETKIDAVELEKLIAAELAAKPVTAPPTAKRRNSVFAFGVATVPPGDRPRATNPGDTADLAVVAPPVVRPPVVVVPGPMRPVPPAPKDPLVLDPLFFGGDAAAFLEMQKERTALVTAIVALKGKEAKAEEWQEKVDIWLDTAAGKLSKSRGNREEENYVAFQDELHKTWGRLVDDEKIVVRVGMLAERFAIATYRMPPIPRKAPGASEIHFSWIPYLDMKRADPKKR